MSNQADPRSSLRRRAQVARNPFDAWAKAIAGAIAELIGQVETERVVAPPAQYIDLAYDNVDPTRLKSWTGWLGRMIAAGPGMLEHFSRAPGTETVDECVRKQINYHHLRTLRARRHQQPRPARPLLWLVCAGRPRKALHEHEARPMRGWPAGFWSSRRHWWLRFVVLRELPVDRSTLLLRLMARDRLLAQALAELKALPPKAPERRLLTKLWLPLAGRSPQDTSEEPMHALDALEELRTTGEKIMRELTTKARKQGMQKGRLEGRRVGLREGERLMLMRILTRRFGRLPKAIVTRIEAANTPELELWGERVLEARSLADVFR